MSKRREITLNSGEYRSVWCSAGKGTNAINCDVYKGEEKILEWEFPKVLGSIGASAAVLHEQAIIYAKERETTK